MGEIPEYSDNKHKRMPDREVAGFSDLSTQTADRRRVFFEQVGLLTQSGLFDLCGGEISLDKADKLSSILEQSAHRPLQCGLLGSDGRYYLGMAGSGLLIADPVRGLSKIETPRMVTSIFETQAGRILIGLNGGSLASLSDEKVRINESVQNLPERIFWHTPWNPDDVDLHSFVQSRDGTIYVAVHVGGVLKSSDGGENWEQLTDGFDRMVIRGDGRRDITEGAGLNPDVHGLVLHPEHESLICAVTRDGFYLSENGGDSFISRNSGIDSLYPGALNYQRAVAVFPDRDVLLVSTASGPGAVKDSRIFRSSTLGASWEKVAGLPERVDHIDTIECFRGGFALALCGSKAYGSDDYGNSWFRIESALNDYYTSPLHHVVRPVLQRSNRAL